jgi:hypothetical protein
MEGRNGRKNEKKEGRNGRMKRKKEGMKDIKGM